MKVKLSKKTNEVGIFISVLWGIIITLVTFSTLVMVMPTLIFNSYMSEQLIPALSAIINCISVVIGATTVKIMRKVNIEKTIIIFVSIYLLILICAGMLFNAIDVSMFVTIGVSCVIGALTVILLSRIRNKRHVRINRKRHYR